MSTIDDLTAEVVANLDSDAPRLVLAAALQSRERSLDGIAELRSLRRLRLEHVPINEDALACLRSRSPNTEILA